MNSILDFFSFLFTPCTTATESYPPSRQPHQVAMPKPSNPKIPITPSNTKICLNNEKQQFTDKNQKVSPVTLISSEPEIFNASNAIPKLEENIFLSSPISCNFNLKKSDQATKSLNKDFHSENITSSRVTMSKHIKKEYYSLDQYIDIMSDLIRMNVQEKIKSEQKKCVDVEIFEAEPYERRLYKRDNLYFFYGIKHNCRFLQNETILLVSTDYGWEIEAVVVCIKEGKWFICLQSIPQNFTTKFDILLEIDESEDRLLTLLKQARDSYFDDNIINVILGKSVKVEMRFYYQLNDYSTPFFKLNESQNKAVDNAMKYAVSLIQGPPGTGKTTTIMAIVYNLCLLCYGPYELNVCFKGKYVNEAIEQFQYKFDQLNPPLNYNIPPTYNYHNSYRNYTKDSCYNKDHNILICAQKNIPITDIKNKLSFYGFKVLQVFAKSQEQNYQNEPHSLHFKFNKKLKSSHEYSQIISYIKSYEVHNQVNGYQYKKLLFQKKNFEINLRQNIIGKYKIICVTCISSANFVLKTKNFQHIIIDEATQALEAESLICLMKGASQFVLLGDSQQLGAVVESKKAKDLGLDVSLINRLCDLGVPSQMLCEQRRMHPLISEFPSKYFYNGRVKSAKETSNLAPIVLPNGIKCNMIFYNIRSDEEIIDSSYINMTEAGRIVDIVKYLISCNFSQSKIGIITFYEKQVALIKKSFKGLNACKNVEVLTVDGSQGREKEIVILSCVRANKRKNVGFVEDYRRLNVAMTRAQRCLIICGNASTLKSSGVWSRLLKFMNDKKLIYAGKFDKLLPCNLEITVKGSFDPHTSYKYE